MINRIRSTYTTFDAAGYPREVCNEYFLSTYWNLGYIAGLELSLESYYRKLAEI
jgi:hypothetical protein